MHLPFRRSPRADLSGLRLNRSLTERMLACADPGSSTAELLTGALEVFDEIERAGREVGMTDKELADTCIEGARLA